MGLLSGRNKNTMGTNAGTTADTSGTGLTGGHRYSTRSKGGLFSGPNRGPGTTTNATSDHRVGLGSNNVGADAGLGTHNKLGRNGNTATTTGRTNAVGGNTVANDAGLTGSSKFPISPFHLQLFIVDPSAGHGEAHIVSGKIAKGLGKVTGNAHLQMKGQQKMQQGEVEKQNANHLNAADRLENEAANRRQMAGVGTGVHTTAGNMRGGLKH